MKKIYISSPLAGAYQSNIEKARRHCRFVADLGLFPICPHVYFPQFMNDQSPAERKRAMDYALHLLRFCDEVWYWTGDDGKISRGMKEELTMASLLGIPCVAKT